MDSKFQARVEPVSYRFFDCRGHHFHPESCSALLTIPHDRGIVKHFAAASGMAGYALMHQGLPDYLQGAVDTYGRVFSGDGSTRRCSRAAADTVEPEDT